MTAKVGSSAFQGFKGNFAMGAPRTFRCATLLAALGTGWIGFAGLVRAVPRRRDRSPPRRRALASRGTAGSVSGEGGGVVAIGSARRRVRASTHPTLAGAFSRRGNAMTQPSKKEGERFFVEKAAELLGKTWCLGPDRETPDFIVSEGEQQFGLEVCEIFTGAQSTAGSHMKRKESITQKAVSALRQEYESRRGIPLIVKFVGDMSDENMAVVLPALEAMNLSSKPFGHHDITEVDEGKAKLRVHITRALQANWFSVNDRAGWVDRNPVDRIAKEIEKKSEKQGLSRCPR